MNLLTHQVERYLNLSTHIATSYNAKVCNYFGICVQTYHHCKKVSARDLIHFGGVGPTGLKTAQSTPLISRIFRLPKEYDLENLIQNF